MASMRRATQGSWLDGPRVDAAERRDGSSGYPGERLGLPPAGPMSVPGLGRRIVALLIDWLACLLVVALFTGHRLLAPGDRPILTLAVFALEYVLLLTALGTTFGMRLMGIGVRRLDGSRLPFRWVLVRTVLLLCVVPAAIYDTDYRGLHDRAAGCVVVRL